MSQLEIFENTKRNLHTHLHLDTSASCYLDIISSVPSKLTCSKEIDIRISTFQSRHKCFSCFPISSIPSFLSRLPSCPRFLDSQLSFPLPSLVSPFPLPFPLPSLISLFPRFLDPFPFPHLTPLCRYLTKAVCQDVKILLFLFDLDPDPLGNNAATVKISDQKRKALWTYM